MALVFIKRQYYQGKVVAYLKKNGSVLRYKLCTIESKYLNSRYRVKKEYPNEDYETLNAQIDKQEEQVDEAIGLILKENPNTKITNTLLADFFHKKEQQKHEELAEPQEIITRDFGLYIEEMKIKKAKEDNERNIQRKLHPSCKDYISTRNALLDFEHDRRETIFLQDITLDFLEEFIDFLADERVDSAEYKYKTKGGLVNGTINKRLDCLSTFVRHYYKDAETAELISRERQDNQQTEIIRLSKEEVVYLYNMKLESESEIRIRDFFVFVCLTGLRFSDLIRIDESNFVTVTKNDVHIELYTQKTTKWADIPLTKQALLIAEKYNFDFGYYTNQAFNRMLKDFLRKYDLFGDKIKQIRQIKKGYTSEMVCRRDRISAHAGRRTFISILVERGTNLSLIMGMTGHTKSSTLKFYIDKFSPNLREAIKPLEF